MDRSFGVADQIQVFVNPMRNAAADTEPDLLSRKIPQVGRQCGIGQFDARRAVLHCAGGE